MYTTHHVYVQICLNPRDICIDTKQLYAEYTQDISTYVHMCVGLLIDPGITYGTYTVMHH